MKVVESSEANFSMPEAPKWVQNRTTDEDNELCYYADNDSVHVELTSQRQSG